MLRQSTATDVTKHVVLLRCTQIAETDYHTFYWRLATSAEDTQILSCLCCNTKNVRKDARDVVTAYDDVLDPSVQPGDVSLKRCSRKKPYSATIDGAVTSEQSPNTSDFFNNIFSVFICLFLTILLILPTFN